MAFTSDNDVTPIFFGKLSSTLQPKFVYKFPYLIIHSNSILHIIEYVMEGSQYPQTQKHPLIKNKKRLNQEQVRIMETNFCFNNKLDPDRKHQLALELGVPPRQVSIWYQNKRAREKNQSLETDHRALQQRLENVLAENTSLRGEVERLRGELCKIEELFNGFNSTVSSSCDEVGSSKHDLESEYYAELIGSAGGHFVAFGGL